MSYKGVSGFGHEKVVRHAEGFGGGSNKAETSPFIDRMSATSRRSKVDVEIDVDAAKLEEPEETRGIDPLNGIRIGIVDIEEPWKLVCDKVPT